MIRLLLFLLGLAGCAWLLSQIADQPGDVALTFGGQRYETSLLTAAVALLVAIAAAVIALGVLRWLTSAPWRWSRAAKVRRREKSLDALSRGMVAAGAGDLRTAQRASEIAAKGLGETPLALMLRAQTAQLAGDRDATRATFAKLAARDDTRALGLRGLHVEARRAGDHEAAVGYAMEAHKLAPVAWAGAAVLEHHSGNSHWQQALKTVETNAAQRLVDRATAERQRAALKTAIALDLGDRNQDEALRLSREAAAAAPDIVPAVTLAARLMARRGDLRKAAKLLEGAWRAGPHPDIARAYVDMRAGDAALDRLARARSLARLAPDDAESPMCVARAALDAREFKTARDAMAPLIDANAASRPTARVCLLMADIEEAERGQTGLLREWLSRASRAPRDKAWIADGVISDTWAPVSPATGKLDAFRWAMPSERLAANGAWTPPVEPLPLQLEPAALENAPIVETPATFDAGAKLASIRDAARRAPQTQVADLDPITHAPDDPGPKAAD